MTTLKKFPLFHIFGTITFLVLGLLVNVAQVVCFLLLPRKLFYRLNYFAVTAIYGYLVFLADWWGGASLTIYCSDQFYEKLQQKSFHKRQVVVLNHHTELDWLFAWQLADRAGLLGGCRALAKNTLAFVPIIGWSSLMSGDIFLTRSWEKDQSTVKTKIDDIEQQPLPTWLFLFPEGTRLSPAKLKASQEFAASRGLPILKHHLVPRTKGFCLVASSMEGGLLDLTFVPGKDSPPQTLASLLSGQKVDTRVIVREFHLKDLPKEPEEMAAWLHKLWQEKDLIKEKALKEDWEGLEDLGFEPFKEAGVGRVMALQRPFPARSWSLYYGVVSNLVIILPLVHLIVQGGPLTWMMAWLVFALAWLALHQLVNVSKIKEKKTQ